MTIAIMLDTNTWSDKPKNRQAEDAYFSMFKVTAAIAGSVATGSWRSINKYCNACKHSTTTLVKCDCTPSWTQAACAPASRPATNLRACKQQCHEKNSCGERCYPKQGCTGAPKPSGWHWSFRSRKSQLRRICLHVASS